MDNETDTSYPWHEQYWQYFNNLVVSGRVPHAVLITGPIGIGKHAFAKQLSDYLLCLKQHESDKACGTCKTCQLSKAGTHPDFINISPVDKDKAISVDDIRGLIEKLHLTLHFDQYKVALIEAAGQMNTNAANALLKTLEEPTPNTIMILVSHSAQHLSSTIRSRCHHVKMTIPGKEESLQWLNELNAGTDWDRLLVLAKGAPLHALDLVDTELLDQRITVIKEFLHLGESGGQPLLDMNKIESISMLQIIEWIQGIILDIVRLKSMQTPVTLENPDFYRSLLALAPRLDVRLVLEFWDWLLERKKLFDVSLNRRLFVEDIFIQGHRLLKNVH